MRSRWKRTAAVVVDALLSVLAPLLVRSSSSSELPSAPRVLVVRCDHIGDAVMATAVLGPLRDALQPSTLDVLVGPWSTELFASHPKVDRVIAYATPWWSAVRGARWLTRMAQWVRLPGLIRRIRAERYDIGIDLRGDLRQITLFLALGGMPVRVSSDRTGGVRLLTHAWPFDKALHEVEKNLAIVRLLGATGTSHLEVPLHTPPAWLQSSLTGAARERGYVVFALQGSAPKRSWPAANAARVVDALQREMHLGSVFIGGADDAALGREVEALAQTEVLNLAGRTSIAETTAVIQGARLTIAVDSGPMHLAAASDSPVVALFGPGDPRIHGPWSARAEVVAVDAPCGCAHPTCDFSEGAGACMRSISPDLVLDAVRRILGANSPVHP